MTSDTFYCNACERDVDTDYIHLHNGHGVTTR